MNTDRRYSTVLFDLDGTLLDYGRAQSEAVKALKKSTRSLNDVSADALLELVNSREIQMFEACRPDAPAPDSSEMMNVFRETGISADPSCFLSIYFNLLSWQPFRIIGAEEILLKLHDSHALVAVSNGQGPVQRKRLELAGLVRYFDSIVLSCEVGIAKPDPRILLEAMKLVGARRESTLFVGDSAGSDMTAAEALGIDFAYFRPEGDFNAGGKRAYEIIVLSCLTDIIIDEHSPEYYD